MDTREGGFIGRVRAETSSEVFELCGDIRAKAPSFGLLLMLNLANALPPLGFGFVFAFPALKQLLHATHAKIRPSSKNPTSGAKTVPSASQ